MMDRGFFMILARDGGKVESIVGTNVENRGVPGIQGGTNQGKTQTGRVVQCRVADVQTSDQMAASSGTSWRTTADHTVAVTGSPETIRETENAVEENASRIRLYRYGSTSVLLAGVKSRLVVLEKKREDSEDGSVLFCAAVVQEMDRLIARLALNNPGSNDYKRMIFQLGPLYVKHLHSALEILKSKADYGCGWEYHEEIVLIGKYLSLQEDKLSDNEDLLRMVCQQIIDDEMCFLDHIKDHPLKCVVRMPDAIFNSLLHVDRIRDLTFSNPSTLSEIIAKKQQLMEIIMANLDKDGVEIDIERLKEDVHRGTACKLDRRLYLCVLKDQRLEQKELYYLHKYDGYGFEKTFFYLNGLLKVYNECTSFLSEFHSLPRTIGEELTGFTKLMMKESCISGVQLEERMVSLILGMVADNVVNRECRRLCLRCKELDFPPETTMRTVVHRDKITDTQCRERLVKIESLLSEDENVTATVFEAEWLRAPEMLRQLLYNHLHEIKTLPKAKEHLYKIHCLEDKMCSRLFSPIFQSYYKHLNKDNEGEPSVRNIKDKAMIDKMSHYHHMLTQLIPYKFVVLKEIMQGDLARMSCFVWGDVLSRLAEGAESFREKDVECLLDLKHLAPCVPNPLVRSVLEKVLSRFFQMASSPGGVGEIPGEKIAALSQWVHDLNLVKAVDGQLKKSHDLWKEAHGYAANERDMALSKSDMPSTSMQGPNNSQETPRPEGDRVAVSVITCRDDALDPSESEKTPSRGEILTRPGALPSATNVGFPESQVDIKKDEMLDPHFCEKRERLARDIADNEVVTRQASPGTPWLQDADQISFSTGEYVPPVTVTTPVDMMTADGKMETQKLDTNVASCGVPKAQGRTVQGVQTGRAGQRDAAVVPEFHQMAATASNTFQQTTSDDEMVVQGTPETAGAVVSAEATRAIKTEKCAGEVLSEVQSKIETSIATLTRKQHMSGVDNSLFCLIVIGEFQRVKGQLKIKDPQSQDYKALISGFSLYYTNSLRSLLEKLENKVDGQYIWEYHKDIIAVARHFFLQPNESPDKSCNRELLKRIYRLAIDNELSFLDFAKEFPLVGVTKYSCNILLRLLDWKKNKPECNDLELLSSDELDHIKHRLQEIMTEIKAGKDGAMVDQLNYNDGEIGKYIEKVEKDLCGETVSVLTRRLYAELLKVQLQAIRIKITCTKCSGMESVRQQFLIAKQLWTVYGKCTTFIPECGYVKRETASMISGVIKRILNTNLECCAQFEEEMLIFVGFLMNEGVLSDGCITIYLHCKELHALMRTAVQPVKMTDDQCKAELNEIDLLLDAETEVSGLAAVAKLRQLLFFNRLECLHSKWINKQKARINKILFEPVAKTITDCQEKMKDRSDDECDILLRELMPKIVALRSCTFVIDCQKKRLHLLRLMCFVWRYDLKRIAKAESVTGRDVDCLIELKHVVPDVPRVSVMNPLKDALDNCLLLCTSREGCDETFAEKVEELTEWRRDIGFLYNSPRYCLLAHRS